MALWNRVQSGFNADDETVNFGARTVAENNGSIYETTTLATFQSDGQVIDNPNVSASIQFSMLCVAVDKSITIFSNESCQEIILSVGFDDVITAYCLSSDAAFLCVALATGVVHCLHIASGGRQFFYQNVVEKFVDSIVKVCFRESDAKIHIIAIATSGVIYSIEGFNLKSAHSALIDNDEDRLEEIVRGIDCIEIFKGSQITQAECLDLDVATWNSSIVTIGKHIQTWPSARRCGHLGTLPFEYIKQEFFKNYGSMVCLRADGVLSIVCLETLLGRRIWTGPVADFLTVQDQMNDPYQILILMKPEKGSTTTHLRYLSFPDFECIFEMSVPTTTYLVNLVGCSVDNIVFLEGIKNEVDRIETIRVKAIVESIPEYRLQRLLRREQFGEAESFARQFHLSLESVHEAKAAAFINKQGPWTDCANDDAKFDTFISTLDLIKDVKYIYDCCINALTSNFKQTRRLISYARQRITKHIEESKTEDFAALLSTLNVTLRKLETFEIIQKTKIDVEDDGSEDVGEWIKFSRANLLEECIQHLTLGELVAAAAIWIRHVPELAPIVTLDMIPEILQSIPEIIAPGELWPWLCHFVPSVIALLPSSHSEIIQWGYKRTRSLEKYRRIEWPQIGFDFSQRLLDLLSVQECNVSFHLHQQYSSKNSHLHRLMTLVQATTDLLELKTVHRIVLPLETYLGDPTTVIHLLLNKSHVESIPNLVEKFVQRYILTHSLQNDQVFASYVQKTLENSKDWWSWEKAPWENRVSIAIGYIHNLQNRLRHTVDVLKKVPVPWSDTIIALAEVSYTFDHPLVSKIRTEHNGIAVKLILKKYGYAHVGLCTNFLRYIIKQDRSDMIDDLCELTRTDNYMRREAFCFCTNHQLDRGDINKAMDVLSHVDDDIVQYCCEQIINFVDSGFTLNTRLECLEHYVEALGPVGARLEKICSQMTGNVGKADTYIKSIIPRLKSIHKLHKQFDIIISVNQYLTEKNKVLDRYIDGLGFDHENDRGTALDSCRCLEKVCDLLGQPPLASILQFFHKTADIAIIKRSIERMAVNGITCRDESRYLSQLCSAWMTNAERDPEISLKLQSLCASNFLGCDTDLLHDAVLCNSQANAYVAAIGFEDTCEPEPEPRINVQTPHALYTVYKDAAVSSEQKLLPLFKDSLSICNYYKAPKSGEKSSASYEEIELLVINLLNRTKEIQNEHYDYSLLQIMQHLHYSLSSLLVVNSEVMTETRHVLTHCLYTLLRKVVGARSLDITLGLSCLFTMTEENASKWLTTACRSYHGDLNRHRAAVALGSEYYRLINHGEQLEVFNGQKLLHQWGRKLTDYGISCKEVLASNLDGKRNILERIMNSNKPNLLPILEEYCIDFGFDLEDCFLLYLKSLLSFWQPRLNFTTSSGRKELTINEDDVVRLREKCNEVAARITDKASMKQHLTQLSPQINFYHYEVFLIMLDLLGEKHVQRIEHFCFLQNYTRYGPPSDVEHEEWANLGHENTSIPPIAEWRLPFLPKIDQWKLITPELNLKTYEKWLSIAPTLNLQAHLICTLAIKGSVTEAWKSFNNDRARKNEWCLYPRNSALLKDIKTCIQCMTGPEGSYYGTAALYYVINHTPQGADQVAAAQACFDLAQLWDSQSSESNEASIEKIKDKYLGLTSKHILHTHGLGEERYLNHVESPERLVRELYNDESIPERFKGAIKRRPDINSAANALATIFSMNLAKMRFDMLLQWLQSETCEEKPNDSLTMGFGNSSGIIDDNSDTEDNLLRACYILEIAETELYANFLINIAFNNKTDDGYGPGVRFRALRVLQSISDETTLERLTKRDSKNVRDHMKCLQYVNELEHLGLGYSVSSFESCSKHKLAQILMKTQYYSPRALRLVMQIYVDFALRDNVLVNATLERMAKQSMAKDLEKFLPVIETMSDTVIRCSSGYIAGWQTVIASPFGKLDPRPNSNQIADCIRSLRLLHACPVVAQLEFRDIINRCLHCQQAHLAAALLPFLNEKDQLYIAQAIEQNYQYDQVVDDLNTLTPKGILTASQSLQILKDIQPSSTAAKSELK